MKLIDKKKTIKKLKTKQKQKGQNRNNVKLFISK